MRGGGGFTCSGRLRAHRGVLSGRGGGAGGGAYVVQLLVSLQGVELQVPWLPVQHQGLGAGVHHQRRLHAVTWGEPRRVGEGRG